MVNYSFRAKYYDGKSSLGFDAEVEFLENSIKISFYNAQHQWTFVKWEIEKIVSAEHLSKSSASIQYGGFPSQYIESSDAECIDIYRGKYLRDSIFTQLYHKAVKGNTKLIVTACAAVVFFAATGYFFLLPKMADYFAEYMMAKDWEIAMGENFYQNLTKDMSIDSTKSELANNFLKETGFATTYPVKITVVKSSIINAFAMPGGHIIVFDTMLSIIKSPEELAALLGHELTHIEKRHSTRMLCRNLAGYMFISLISGDINGISAILVENAHAVAGLKYVRSLEEEADKNGMELLSKSKLNPKGMVDLLSHLQKVESEKNEWLQLLLSHPLTENRIEYCKENIKRDKPKYTKNQKLNQLYSDLVAKQEADCDDK